MSASVFFKRFVFIVLVVVMLLLPSPTRAQISSGSNINEINEIADTPWPMYQHDPQHTGRSPLLGLVHTPTLAWTAQLPDCNSESGGISIAKDGSLLISSGGCLQSFDPVKRQLQWFVRGGLSRSAPLVASDGNIYWGYENSFGQFSPDGTANWAVALDINMVFGSSATFGIDGNLYFVHDGVWSFNPGGNARWYTPYGLLTSHASPAIGADGTVYAGSDNLDICAYLPDQGAAYWCIDTPGSAGDRTSAVGEDGTIYLPTEGSINASSGVLVAITQTGSVLWTFQPPEENLFGIPDGIAISRDGSIRFGLNTGYAESYLYSVSADGSFQWKVPLPPNPTTGVTSFMSFPITVDRAGNTFSCVGTSRCYAIDSTGAILWEYEFPLSDSIVVSAVTQPVIAADGLFYVVDNQQRLYAFTDPDLYPAITASPQEVDQQVIFGMSEATSTIAISSTVASITYTALVSPTVDWLSVLTATDITPGRLDVLFETDGLLPGRYQTSIKLIPTEQSGEWLEIPVRLLVIRQEFQGDRTFLPVLSNSYFPDHRILYVSEWFAELQLASIAQSGKDRRAIANLNPYGQIEWYVYSPDGEKLALVSYINDKYQISVVDAKTGALLLRIADPWMNMYPGWAPDGDRLAFISTRDNPNGDVYVINLDGTGLARLTNNEQVGEDILWSPTGAQIALDNRWETYLMNSDGTDFHQLVTGHFSDTPLGWSPDGKYLLLTSLLENVSGPRQLGIFDVVANTYTVIADGWVNEAAWSPDGKLIAYASDEDIYLIGSDGSGLVNLTANFDKEASQPAWSPDSRWLAFAARRGDIANDPNYDLYAIMINTTSLVQLTTNIQGDSHPFWIP